MICAWHETLTSSFSSPTLSFDPSTSHGICIQCAIQQLAKKPRVLIRFLLRQGYSRDSVAFLLRTLKIPRKNT